MRKVESRYNEGADLKRKHGLQAAPCRGRGVLGLGVKLGSGAHMMSFIGGADVARERSSNRSRAEPRAWH